MAIGTIKPASEPNFERQAEYLRKAMKGLGTDERRIIQILCSHDNDQRQEIATQYKTMYGRDLIDDLKSELSGCFEDAVVALMVPQRKYDALNIHKAIKGAGTNENTLIEILCPRTNNDIYDIKKEYKKSFKQDLDAVLDDELSGDFRRIMRALTTANREEMTEVDDAVVEKDVQEVYDAGEGQIGTEESSFIKVLCTRSFDHLRKFFDHYKKVSTKDIEDVIKAETSGDFCEALLCIVAWTKNAQSYYAERLYKTMKGAGTDDDQLIRILVSHSETDLETIKEEFMKKYNKSLQSFVEGDTSGDYKQLLCAIISGGMTPP